MLLRALFTTALLMTNLPQLVASKTAARGKNINPIDPQPLNNLDICPNIISVSSFIKESTLHPPITLLLTKDRITSIISGFNKAKTQYIADCILSITDIHPNIAEYIHLVFNYSPYFTISRYIEGETAKPTLLSHENMGIVAQYDSTNVAMHIYDLFFKSPKEKVLSFLIHEFRHAAINTAYRVLENASPFNSEIYRLHNSREKKIVTNMINHGEKKLLELENLLNKEIRQKNLLSAAEKNYLAMLRDRALPDFNKFYRHLETSVVLEQDEYKQLLANIRKSTKNINAKFEVGVIYQIDALYEGSYYGPFDLMEIKTAVVNKQARVKLIIKMNDPLYAFITHYSNNKEKIKTFMGPIEENFCEIDAYLHQFIPQSLLVSFFPGLHSYPKSFIEQAMATDSNNQAKNTIDGMTQYDRDLIKTIKTPAFFMPDLDNNYIAFAYQAIKNNNYDDAELALQTLLDNNSKLSQKAHTLLGYIAYRKENYSAVISHLEQAEKISPLDTPTRQIYTYALAYEVANRQTNRKIKNNADRL